MDLLHAETIRDGYLNNIKLNMSPEKKAMLGNAVTACLVLGEEITKNNLASKIEDEAIRQQMKSTLFRVVKKIKELRDSNPNIDKLDTSIIKDSLSPTRDAFVELIDETMGQMNTKYKMIIDIAAKQKIEDEISLRNEHAIQLKKAHDELAISEEKLEKAKQVDIDVINNLQSQIAVLTEQLSEKTSVLENTKQTLSETTSALEETRQALSEKEAEQTDVDLLKEKVKRTEAEYESAKGQVDTLQSNSEVAAEITAMQDEEISLLTEQVGKYKKQLQSLMLSNTELSSRLKSQAESNKEESESKVVSIQNELEAQKKNSSAIMEQLASAQKSEESLKACVSDLTEQLSSQCQLIESTRELEQNLKTTQSLLKAAKDKYNLLEIAKENEFHEANLDHERVVNEFNNTIESLKVQLSEQKARTRNVAKELPTLSSSMITASGETDAQLVAHNMELKARNRSLEDQLKTYAKRFSRASLS